MVRVKKLDVQKIYKKRQQQKKLHENKRHENDEQLSQDIFALKPIRWMDSAQYFRAFRE